MEAGNDTHNAILQLAKILNRSDKISKVLPSIQEEFTPLPRVNTETNIDSQKVDQESSLPRVSTYHERIKDAIKQRRQPTLRNATWKRGNDVNIQTRYNLRSLQLAQFTSNRTPSINLLHQGNFKATAAKTLLLQQTLHERINHIYNIHDNKQNLENLIKENPTRWFKALSNEWGRLSHGNDAGVEYTDTIEYIAHTEVPKNKKVTYASFVCDCRPLNIFHQI